MPNDLHEQMPLLRRSRVKNNKAHETCLSSVLQLLFYATAQISPLPLNVIHLRQALHQLKANLQKGGPF